ncbi:hypothetical protein M378DRAFT_159426 [Amanita muscaria Koide BX008]|uniref:Uncharacterized protein n=1 Tax=Amanita muscaria (strain Koide BX008) TaxID=946122 RepID=A0A0C2XFG9_AMAMK|nr:hypothetical protein M378DRAFT_159426 [Amanita muscaria Koide BX008]
MRRGWLWNCKHQTIVIVVSSNIQIQTTCPATDDAAQHEQNAFQSVSNNCPYHQEADTPANGALYPTPMWEG